LVNWLQELEKRCRAHVLQVAQDGGKGMVCQNRGQSSACGVVRPLPTCSRDSDSTVRGFTLLEVVAVLILLGILAAVAISRYSTGNASAVAEAEIFKSCLRYAQVRAMGDISTWGIMIDSNSSYSLFTNNPSIKDPVLPGVGSPTRTLPGGVTVSVVGENFIFDYRGRPVKTTGVEYQKNAVATWPPPLTADTTVTFTGDSAVNVVVMQQTGFAQ
jgi:prepilin-type N-terminal cleavage/methylation domain-containing protein